MPIMQYKCTPGVTKMDVMQLDRQSNNLYQMNKSAGNEKTKKVKTIRRRKRINCHHQQSKPSLNKDSNQHNHGTTASLISYSNNSTTQYFSTKWIITDRSINIEQKQMKLFDSIQNKSKSITWMIYSNTQIIAHIILVINSTFVKKLMLFLLHFSVLA